MRVTCPSCGADMDLDVLLAHEDSRHALARLAALSLPLGKSVLQYLRLFKPPKRQMSHSRVVSLVEELLPDLQRGAITRGGRDWAAPLATWQAAIERVLDSRDKLSLPLKGHGYLYEVIVSVADKIEAEAERQREEGRRGARSYTEGPVTVETAVAAPAAPAAPPPSYSQPSPYARRMQAEIAAKKAVRDGSCATFTDQQAGSEEPAP